MDDNVNGCSKSAGGKCLRPVRNRRYSRKTFAVGNRPAKRLFTPEIKKLLKDWLVRRRDNPYPNREEKKILAVETGLTYVQICNWFANWRRKLKNSGNEDCRKTWGDLIKTYNNHAQGNVEQFSICSDDSIWGEPYPHSNDTYYANTEDIEEPTYRDNIKQKSNQLTFSKLQISNRNNDQCYHISSTTEEIRNEQATANIQTPGNKYKNHIMEKYLKGLQGNEDNVDDNMNMNDTKYNDTKPFLLNKWLESAAKFQPQKSNYVSWDIGNKNKKRQKSASNHPTKDNGVKEKFHPQVVPEQTCNDLNNINNIPPYSKTKGTDTYNSKESLSTDYSTYIHGQEEVEAAVALTRLAGLYRS